MIKITQDNNMTDRMGAVQVKNETELSCLIGPGADYDETRKHNDVTNLQVWSMPKSKLNCLDLFDQMWYVMKTRKDNDVIDRTDVVYIQNKIELSGPI